jgi:hypothetical protein
MLNEDQLLKKWAPIIDHPDIAPIKDYYKRSVTAMVLENQQREMASERDALSEGYINEDGPTNTIGGGHINKYDPILISLVRRALPNLIAYDIAGVQPMTGPTGLIFAMRSRYNGQSNTPDGAAPEAFYNEANTIFSGIIGTDSVDNFRNSAALATSMTTTAAGATANNAVAYTSGTPAVTTTPADFANFHAGQAMSTAYGEKLGTTGHNFNEMAISIDKVTVTAGTRALKAEYSIELAQDLKAIHGVDAETELSNILSTEILAEINRECIRTVYTVARPGAQYGTVTKGMFDLDTDSNGRWSVERFKGLIYQIEREANAIAKETRRGKGNIMIVSSDVASALAMAGVLQYTPALSADLQVDDTGNTYCGMLHGRIKVYIDPYFGGSSDGYELACIGYKGSSPYDAGIFYCPYVPLQMVRAVDPNTFQPKIGFKTRYGLTSNPFAGGTRLDSG